MKTNKIVYRKGTFTDHEGLKRPYVFAAVSGEGNSEDFSVEGPSFVIKSVGVGFSIVHPSDLNRTKKVRIKGVETDVPVYDETIGEQIAVGKATHYKNSRVLFTTEPGFINTKVVNALLEQEEAHFLSNPKAYIANYERDRVKANYAKLGGEEIAQKIEKTIEQLNDLRSKHKETLRKAQKHEII
jgi:hypothetical protein